MQGGTIDGAQAKRGLDLVLSLLLVVVCAPLLAIVALAIRIDSAGPVIFRQTRVGARRRPDGSWVSVEFEVLKFRSMRPGVDESRHREYISAFVNGSIEQTEGQNRRFKLTDDDRITRVGRVIRRLSLDELPQLFNVVRGEMSLVGPRPVPVYEVEGYSSHHRERFNALPGITGLWQVRGRGRVTFEEMVQMDIEYVRERDMWLDVRLLVATIPAALTGRGAG